MNLQEEYSELKSQESNRNGLQKKQIQRSDSLAIQ